MHITVKQGIYEKVKRAIEQMYCQEDWDIR